MAYDGKYGEVTTEFGEFEENEPVVVFRAKDKLMVPTLHAYRQMCAEAGSSDNHLAILDETIQRIASWQSQHETRIPVSAGPAGRSYFQRNT